jgi:galactokinase/mevalonate kinase-like predicted kinase
MVKRFRLSVPARINVLGNPSDGLEGDFQTISTAIELRAGAWVEPAGHLQFAEYQRGADGQLALARLYEDPDVALARDGRAQLQKAALRRLSAFDPGFATALRRQPVRLATWTDVPRQSGLAGSSLLVMLTLAAMRVAYELDARKLNDYVLAELTQRTEALDLDITCGYADRYVPLLGGLAYIDYRGKLWQQPLDGEPYATYERLDGHISEFPLVVCSTGVQRDSGEVHGVMRARYLREQKEWDASGGPGQDMPFMLRVMRAVGSTAWRGKIALLHGDWPAFGALMNENHRLVNEMMFECGFRGGAGTETNRLIEAALAAGALGAKLTGAGGGGSVFALVMPGDQARVADVLRQEAREVGLNEAVVFTPQVARRGLIVEEMA